MIFEFTSIFIVIICWKGPLSDTNWWILIYHPVNSLHLPFNFSGQNCLEKRKLGGCVFYINKGNCEKCFLLVIALKVMLLYFSVGLVFRFLDFIFFAILVTDKKFKFISTHFRHFCATVCAFKWFAGSFIDCNTSKCIPTFTPLQFWKDHFYLMRNLAEKWVFFPLHLRSFQWGGKVSAYFSMY